jgi:hypothetical protein
MTLLFTYAAMTQDTRQIEPFEEKMGITLNQI